MKRILLALSASLLLAACDSTPTVSSRPPRGNPAASVTVQEYADLQCPACQSAHSAIVKPILEKYGNQIRYEFKHFPLRSLHRFALDAAEASECAADQGKFWEFVDMAYEKQDDLSFEALVLWGGDLKLDVQKYERCWKSHEKRDIVLSDYEEGKDLGVGGTPSFFVQGQRVESGFDTLSAAIDKALGLGMPL